MVLSAIGKLFSVYIHTSPEGKVYVGITSQDPSMRWGFGGRGYIDNKHFWSAIQKYGWDNFSHQVIAEGLSLTAACEKEQELISLYNSIDPKYGYNQTTGGNWSTPSDEVRSRLSESIRLSRQDPEARSRWIAGLVGHRVSNETKVRISNAKLGKKLGPSPLKGRPLSPEHRKKLKGRTAWNKGETKETSESVAKYAASRKGVKVSDETRARQSVSQRARYANGYEPVWVHNSTEEKLVNISDLQHYIDQGYLEGRLCNKDRYIHKDGRSIKVSSSELPMYLSEGWELGRPPDTCSALRKSTQKYVWVYEGIRFDTATALAEYLRANGYPKIVASTITALYNKGSFSSSKVYHTLDGKIERLTPGEIHENS